MSQLISHPMRYSSMTGQIVLNGKEGRGMPSFFPHNPFWLVWKRKQDLHVFASFCAMGKNSNKKPLPSAASFCEEICPGGYFLFVPILKSKIGSLPLNNTFLWKADCVLVLKHKTLLLLLLLFCNIRCEHNNTFLLGICDLCNSFFQETWFLTPWVKSHSTN